MVEEVAGSKYPHIVVQQRAVERLGIETTVVRSPLVTRKRTVAARVLSREARQALRDKAGAALGDPAANVLRVLPIWDAAAIAPDPVEIADHPTRLVFSLVEVDHQALSARNLAFGGIWGQLVERAAPRHLAGNSTPARLCSDPSGRAALAARPGDRAGGAGGPHRNRR